MSNFKQLGQDTLYTIETSGGVIGFDIADSTMVARIEKMYDQFKREERRFKQTEVVIDKKNNTNKNKYGMAHKDRDRIQNFNDFIKNSCKFLDELFGEGSSDMIFYDTTLKRVVHTEPRMTMVLYELLPQEFEKAGVKMEKFNEERLKPENRQKYVTKDKKVDKLD